MREPPLHGATGIQPRPLALRLRVDFPGVDGAATKGAPGRCPFFCFLSGDPCFALKGNQWDSNGFAECLILSIREAFLADLQ